MDNKKIDEKIISELNRYNSINNYIVEQEAMLPPTPEEEPIGDDELPAGDVGTDIGVEPPVEPTDGELTPLDIDSDPDVEKIGDDDSTDNEESGNEESDNEESDNDVGTEELEITDLVNSQKSVENKQDEYFTNLFNQLNNLEDKLSNMDEIVNQLNSLESKVEKYRPKTPEEKLELRSIDSGPYKQKLSDFFVDKQDEMEKSGKNEYVLTSDDIEDFSQTEVKDSFRDFNDDELNLDR